jgi:hypothetical protein
MTTRIARRLRAALLLAMLTISTLGVAAPAAHALAPCYDCGGNAAPRTYTHVVTASERPSFIGWAKVEVSVPGNAAPGVGETFQAWRWSGRAWSSVTIAKGQAYVYPYATGWSWVWRSSTGWLAIRSSSVVLGTVQRPCSQPPSASDTSDWTYGQNCLGVMY